LPCWAATAATKVKLAVAVLVAAAVPGSSMNFKLLLGLGAGGLGGLRAAGSARNLAAVASVATISSVAYVRSFPAQVPAKDPSDQQ